MELLEDGKSFPTEKEQQTVLQYLVVTSNVPKITWH